jgi:ribosome-associated protein YbcJ (S4-like RNA binding protein)
MKRSDRLVWFGAIALAAIILLTFVTGPQNNKLNIGSTYSRSPDGYGAWYHFMQSRGITIQRWQKPFSDLKTENVTLIQVNSYSIPPELDKQEQEWVEKGNNIAILGVNGSVSAAKFSTMQKSLVGNVKIETRRRRQIHSTEKVVLGDRFGAIVWEKHYGKGKAIFSTTPYLAANAYQDYRANYQYLSDLVSEKGNLLLIDEYIHGYKDSSIRNREGEGDLASYFAKTPLFPGLVLLSVLLLVLIWGQNRRFGKPVSLETPTIDNSKDYIQALAQVLEKAEAREFVVEMVGKEEQLQLQKALGLGQELLDYQTLANAWAQQTGSSPTELDAVLTLQKRKRRISEKELISWLGKWQTFRSIKN